MSSPNAATEANLDHAESTVVVGPMASDVPPWLREHIPLIYVDGELAAVAGMWVGEGLAVAGGERGWVVSWSALPD